MSALITDTISAPEKLMVKWGSYKPSKYMNKMEKNLNAYEDL